MDPTIPYNRGLLRRQQHDLEAAIADFTTAIDLDPAYSAAYTARGEAYLLQREVEAADADLTSALRLDRSDADAYYYRGLARVELDEKPGRSLADFSKALRLRPDWVDALYHRGLVYHAIKRPAHAAEDFKRVLELDPHHPQAEMMRAVIADVSP